MKKIIAALVVPLALVLSIVVSPTAGAAPAVDGMRKSAEEVAALGGCANVRSLDTSGDKTVRSAVVCDLGAKQVGLATFTRSKREALWVGIFCAVQPKKWVLVGNGFVAVSRKGHEGAARTARRAYGGVVVHCKKLLGD